MKKIVALVLSLVMVLGLAATAFAAVPVWGTATTVTYDKFDAKSNVCTAEDLTFSYVPAKAPVLDKDGYCVTAGNIAYWIEDATQLTFVMVDKYSEYAAFAVKNANPAVVQLGKQTTIDTLFFMVPVAVVEYGYTATAFTAFADGCGNYSKPAGTLATDVFGKVDAGAPAGSIYKLVAATAGSTDNVLMNGVVYAAGTEVTANKHAWSVVDYTAKGAVDTCKCVVCGIEGQWVESIYLAPAAAKVDAAFGGYVYYGVAAADDKVESAQTFDAGIAMYVGMSVMAAAGSAVVLKKKD